MALSNPREDVVLFNKPPISWVQDAPTEYDVRWAAKMVEWCRLIAEALDRTSSGKLNNTCEITLTANTTTTTITDDRISVNSALPLTPLTANAAAALATTYASTRADGSVVFTHADNAQLDRTFVLAILA